MKKEVEKEEVQGNTDEQEKLVENIKEEVYLNGDWKKIEENRVCCHETGAGRGHSLP